MQLDKIGVVLRVRSPWEAIDLGFAMLRSWWRPVYLAWATVVFPLFALCLLAGWLWDMPWLAMLLVWWLKPLYDRVVLHVLSRAVFGEILTPSALLGSARQWLGTGLFSGLVLQRFNAVRSFILPVRQLEGLVGRAERQRVALLSRRARNYAVWLTLVCLHFEAVFVWSQGMFLRLLLPAKSEETRSLWEAFREGSGAADVLALHDVLAYALAITLVEPFYVAAGLALYLNRRSLLEGWDIEVALRRIAETRKPSASAMLLVAVAAALALAAPPPATAQSAQRKDPRQEIREVLKAPEFQTSRETTRWVPRDDSSRTAVDGQLDLGWLRAIGHAIARSAEVLFWILAGALAAAALWWLYRALPREAARRRAAYQPPPMLFGLDIAPQSLPADISGAAAALAAAGRVREALSLLYRGALSELVLRRGVELHGGHTEEEVLRRANERLSRDAGDYFSALVRAWQAAAYARREPSPGQVGELASHYAARFAAA